MIPLGKRITFIFSLLIGMILFALFGTLVATTNTNDAIIEHTEEFVELVRYKGCISEKAYYDFLKGFDVPVEVRITATRKPGPGETGNSLEFTQDIINAFSTDMDGDGKADGLYRMNPGDEISVVVRKPSGNLFDSLNRLLSGQDAGVIDPVVAVKGGMILNTQCMD